MVTEDFQVRKHLMLLFTPQVDADSLCFQVYLIEVNTNPCLDLASAYLKLLIPSMLENVFRLTVDRFYAASKPSFKGGSALPSVGKPGGRQEARGGSPPCSEGEFELVFSGPSAQGEAEEGFGGSSRSDGSAKSSGGGSGV